MREYLNRREIDFILHYRQLSPKQQEAVSWMVRNTDVLEKLVSAEHLSPDELDAVLEDSYRRGDPYLIILAEYAHYCKQWGRCGEGEDSGGARPV